MAASSAGGDAEDLADLLEWKVGPVSQIENLTLALGQVIDLGPDRQSIGRRLEVVRGFIGRRPAKEPLTQASQSPAQPMLVHGPSIDGPEGPCARVRDHDTTLKLVPQPEEGILDGVGCLRVAQPEAPNEPEQLLTVVGFDIQKDLFVGAVTGRLPTASHSRRWDDRLGAGHGVHSHCGRQPRRNPLVPRRAVDDGRLDLPHVTSSQETRELLRQFSCRR